MAANAKADKSKNDHRYGAPSASWIDPVVDIGRSTAGVASGALGGALYLAHMAYTVPRFRDKYERFNEALANLTRLLVDSYSNIETIKLFADPDYEDQESKRAFQEVRRAFTDLQKFEVITNVGMLELGTILLVGLIGFAIVLWQAGEVELGFIAAALKRLQSLQRSMPASCRFTRQVCKRGCARHRKKPRRTGRLWKLM